MYQAGEVSASELRDLETRLIHKLDQADAKWQHQLRALEIRLDSEKRFLEDLLVLFWLSAMFWINLLIWMAVLERLR